jgi:RimJ/RimL family protein N-acetyltransferase
VAVSPIVPGTPRIDGDRVVLLPFARSDVAKLVTWTPDAAFLCQWAGPTLNFPITVEQFDALFEQDPCSPKTLAWQIIEVAHGEAVGHLELTNIDRSAGTAHLMRVLVGPPEARGHGLGAAAVRAVLGVARDLGLREVTLSVFAWNRRAIASYVRSGFEHVGLELPLERRVLQMVARLER